MYFCNLEKDGDNCKKDRIIYKICYNINRKNYNNNKNKRKFDGPMKNVEKPKIDNGNNKKIGLKYENHAYVVIGPRNVGKADYMLKVPEKIGDKTPIHKITRSPNQYPNYKTTIGIKLINKYKGSVVIFDEKLGARNSSPIDAFFTRGRHEDLDVY